MTAGITCGVAANASPAARAVNNPNFMNVLPICIYLPPVAAVNYCN
jgi:hypothetical protein